VHGYSDGDIARFLGTSRGAIGLRFFRVRARLKKLVRGLTGEKS
jgi:DNA-directed RNA polymerase specialized sigma24 family protein